MKGRWGWLPVLVLGSLARGAEPARDDAALPPLPATTRPGDRPASGVLPASSVSPSIARFMDRRAAGAAPSAVPIDPSAVRPLDDPGLPSALPPADETPRAPAGEDPLATGMTLRPAPTMSGDVRLPLNLATALRLSDARPLVVAATQAGVWMAEADLTRANVLWVPSILFGFDYIRHDGGGPDFNKGIMTAPSTNFFYAGGSFFQYINLTDVFYEPVVARRTLDARHWDVQAAKNDALRDTADAYFRVHHSRGTYAGTLYTVERGRELVTKIDRLSRELVPRVEVERARNMLADLEQRSVVARQRWRITSADLTRVLRLDPRALVEPLEHDHAQVTLIDPGRSLDELMSVALTNRPEPASRRALVGAAEARVRREKMRPALPLVLLNGFQSAGMLIQGGVFGLGPNGSLNQWTGRDDVSIQLMWQLENFGMGNLARVKTQRGRQSQAIIDLRRAQDTVAAEVTAALARVQSAAARVQQADRSLRTGIITFNGHLEGLGETRRFGDVLKLTFRPMEAVYSLEQLNVSFDEYFRTVAEYNRAQFELFRALGYPAHEVSRLRSAGELLDVDTSRPMYLPPVGHGPPPATR